MKNVNTIQKNRDGFQSKWGFILVWVTSGVCPLWFPNTVV